MSPHETTRDEIDEIDRQIVRDLAARMRLVHRIASLNEDRALAGLRVSAEGRRPGRGIYENSHRFRRRAL